jgi:pimeloyl-ACP methyl ester carboxylesterase
MLAWPEDLIRLFGQFFIIRFDQRDTGLSTEFPVPANYSLSDMVGDVEGLIDHLDLSTRGFNLVGVSLGGTIAYNVAARRPQQVKSLTLALTTPGPREDLPLGEGIDTGMPPMGFEPNLRQAYIDYHMRWYDGHTTQPDETERKNELERAAQVTDREMRAGTLYSKGLNHGSAAYGPRPSVDIVKDVRCAVTVIQAGLDQWFSEEHGRALANAFHQADYVLWDDIGHELPERIWPRLAGLLVPIWGEAELIWKTSKDLE